MELAWLEDFIALADLASFSRAAARRHVTQPAFSRRVRALEDWVGAALFERTAQGARLTPAGEQFGRGAPMLLRTLGDLRRDAREAGGRESATLRFAATHALSFTFFPAWLRAVEQHGTIGPVRLVSDSMAACERLMLTGEVQFVLCHEHPLAPSRLTAATFASAVVGKDALVPLVAPDDAGGPRWRLDDPAAPQLAYSSDSGLGRILAAHRPGAGDPGQPPIFSAQLAATLLGMALGSRGIAWLPASLAADDMAAGRLVAAGAADDPVPLAVRLFRPVARQSAAAERCWAAQATA